MNLVTNKNENYSNISFYILGSTKVSLSLLLKIKNMMILVEICIKLFVCTSENWCLSSNIAWKIEFLLNWKHTGNVPPFFRNLIYFKKILVITICLHRFSGNQKGNSRRIPIWCSRLLSTFWKKGVGLVHFPHFCQMEIQFFVLCN